MSIATLASDSAVSLPSRGPAWLPRVFARVTASVLRQPARWPFSSGWSQGRPHVLTPVAQPEPADRHEMPPIDIAVVDKPAVDGTSAVVQPSRPVPAEMDAAVAVALPLNTLGAHSQSLGTARQALTQGVTVRQMVVDVLLVAIWGALIPGLMWLGAAAGF